MRLDHLLSREPCFFPPEEATPRSRLVGCAPQGVRTTRRHKRHRSVGEVWCHCQWAGWFPLFSCQGLLTRTFTTALQKYITITSILPRQEEREREAEETRVCVCLDERSRGVAWDVRGSSSSEPGEHKRERVRGGCLGAEGRRRTRRPAKRSGGAACER